MVAAAHALPTMTRPPGTSFAAFFPTAPRAARDKATEREKARLKAHEGSTSSSPSSLSTATIASAPAQQSAQPSVADPDAHVNGADPKPPPPSSHHDAAQLLSDGQTCLTDDGDSPPGDILNVVGSASSHASSTESSVFSSAAGALPAAAYSSRSRVATASLTPVESPGSSGPPSKPSMSTYGSSLSEMSAPRRNDHLPPSSSPSSSALNGTLPSLEQAVSHTERVPARDPNRPAKGLKCIYDPFSDRNFQKLSKTERREAKPKFVEFGTVRIPYSSAGGAGRHLSLQRNMSWLISLNREMTPRLRTRDSPRAGG